MSHTGEDILCQVPTWVLAGTCEHSKSQTWGSSAVSWLVSLFRGCRGKEERLERHQFMVSGFSATTGCSLCPLMSPENVAF